jgi:hypothetical protein
MEYSNQQLINGIRQSDVGNSINTIKTRMKMALAHLCEPLKDYTMILLLFMGI